MPATTLGLMVTAFAVSALARAPCFAQYKAGNGEAREIVEEAFIYGFPMVMNYGVFYEYFIDQSGKEYKAPFNQLHNTARIYTPQDTAIVTPNRNTPTRSSPWIFERSRS